jgi:hypothetical protein
MSVEFKGSQGISLKAMPHYLVQDTANGAVVYYHGLGKIPDIVIVSCATGGATYSYTATATTVTVTVSAGLYSVLCLVED